MSSESLPCPHVPRTHPRHLSLFYPLVRLHPSTRSFPSRRTRFVTSVTPDPPKCVHVLESFTWKISTNDDRRCFCLISVFPYLCPSVNPSTTSSTSFSITFEFDYFTETPLFSSQLESSVKLSVWCCLKPPTDPYPLLPLLSHPSKIRLLEPTHRSCNWFIPSCPLSRRRPPLPHPVLPYCSGSPAQFRPHEHLSIHLCGSPDGWGECRTNLRCQEVSD